MAKLHKAKVNFTQVSNTVLNDKELSAKAKGLYAYLYSKPDHWSFAYNRISKDFSDGEKSILAGLRELEKTGYLERKKQGDGSTIYFLGIDPTAENRHLGRDPTAENGYLPFGLVAEKGTISNTDIHSNTEIYSNTKISLAEKTEKDFSPIESIDSETLEIETIEETTEDPKTETIKNPRAVSTRGTITESMGVSGLPKTTLAETNERRAKLLNFFRKTVGVDKFKDFSEWQETGRMESLIERLGLDEFLRRMQYIISDPFKLKNSNKLSYLRKEIECYIHSPPPVQHHNIC